MNKTYLISGAGSGIGLAMAQKLAAGGDTCILLGRNLEKLQKVVASMKEGAMLVTYCAQGQFKRDIKEAGLEIETLPGPPGKKEMVRGIKQGL